jgi:hypothetical protein
VKCTPSAAPSRERTLVALTQQTLMVMKGKPDTPA